MHVLLVGNFRLGVTYVDSTQNKTKIFVEGFRQIIDNQKEKSFRRGIDEIKINDR